MELCMEIHFSPILYSESYQIEKINIWAQWINFLAFMAFLALWLKLTSLYGLYSGEKNFIGFLAELGNFKHFEPHLFFGKFWPFLALRPLWPSKAKKKFFRGRAWQTASSEQIKFFWVRPNGLGPFFGTGQVSWALFLGARWVSGPKKISRVLFGS